MSCDLAGLSLPDVRRIKELVGAAAGLRPESIMTHCTHTHSGPCTAVYHGWGEMDSPYLEIMPGRVASACVKAVESLREATISHAEVPCEAIAVNREYDLDAQPLDDVLSEDWRPAKPELTDTTCHVIAVRDQDGKLIGFMSYFGCHPVVCCQDTHYIHGDYAGVSANLLEREHPGSIGLFLQGAQGDVNTCVVHKPEKESLLALDVIAARYARAVRNGLNQAKTIDVDSMAFAHRMVEFTRKNVTLDELRQALAEEEAVLHAPDADDASHELRMATVCALAIRERISTMEAGEPVSRPVELQGLRLGPLSLLGAPLEIFQAIKNEIKTEAKSPVPLVMGLTNGDIGYAPDKTTAARGGYAADMVPLIVGEFPFKDIHGELVREMLELEKGLFT